jgi:serine/threonine-protein kinase
MVPREPIAGAADSTQNDDRQRPVERLEESKEAQGSDSTFAIPDVRDGGSRPAGDGPDVDSRNHRYRPVRFHARGGLGEVWLAEDTELTRKVALKRIRDHHHGDPESRRRFLQEAEITARLQHPGIVPVYGLQQEEDGEPTYAMNFIDREDLQTAINRMHQAGTRSASEGTKGPRSSSDARSPFSTHRSLEFRQLLNHFIAVCKTIAYAHSRGVLHRDLKPRNVMLGQYGETFVVDWGLAKTGIQTSASTTESSWRSGSNAKETSSHESVLTPRGQSESTEVGSQLGTPAYMSPEQAAGDIARLSRATDVFGLGTILYAILTGQSPMHGVPWEEVYERVQHGHYPKPHQVKSDVPRPLEAICLKAMALRPEDRYMSAQDVADDVEHWMADEAVVVYREPRLARLGRWTRRHRSLVQGAAALLVTAVIALSLSTYLIGLKERAARAAQESEHEARERADRNFALAQDAVDKTITRMAENDRLKEANFHELRKDLLQSAVPFYEEFVRQQGDSPELEGARGQAYYRLAFVQAETGQYEAARAGFEKARSIFSHLVEVSPDAREPRLGLARSYHSLGHVLKELGLRTGAESTESAYHAELEIVKKLAADYPQIPEYRRKLGGTYLSLGIFLRELGRHTGAEGAETALNAALDVAQELTAEFPRDPSYRDLLASTYLSLGSLRTDLGRRSGPQGAESAYRAAGAVAEELTVEFPAFAGYRQLLGLCRLHLGNLLSDLGRRTGADGAEAVFHAALIVQEKLTVDFPSVPAYRQDLAITQNKMGQLLAGLGRNTGVDSAESFFRSALALMTKLTVEHPGNVDYRVELGTSYTKLANLLRLLGRVNGPEGAESAYRSALVIQQKLVADFPNMPDYRQELALTYNNLGNLLKDIGRTTGPDSAESAYRAALSLREKLASAYPKITDYGIALGGTYGNLGYLMNDAGQPLAALPWFDLAQSRLEPILTDNPGLVLVKRFLRNTHWHRAQALDKLQRHSQAVNDWERAVSLTDPDDRNDIHLSRADSLVHTGQSAEAVKIVNQVLAATSADEGALYDSACIMALASAEGPTVLRNQYARRSVELLRQAVAKGYKDFAHMKKDPDLDPLRNRADFKKLIEQAKEGAK